MLLGKTDRVDEFLYFWGGPFSGTQSPGAADHGADVTHDHTGQAEKEGYQSLHCVLCLCRALNIPS